MESRVSVLDAGFPLNKRRRDVIGSEVGTRVMCLPSGREFRGVGCAGASAKRKAVCGYHWWENLPKELLEGFGLKKNWGNRPRARWLS